MIKYINAESYKGIFHGEYEWSVPIFGISEGGFEVWLPQVMAVVISVGIMGAFISILLELYKVSFQEGDLKELKVKLRRVILALALIILAPIILRALSPVLWN